MANKALILAVITYQNGFWAIDVTMIGMIYSLSTIPVSDRMHRNLEFWENDEGVMQPVLYESQRKTFFLTGQVDTERWNAQAGRNYLASKGPLSLRRDVLDHLLWRWVWQQQLILVKKQCPTLTTNIGVASQYDGYWTDIVCVCVCPNIYSSSA